MKGIAPQTEAIFEQIAQLECISSYTLIGGTALALQLGHRLSEDLDFCRWRRTATEKNSVDWPAIKRELSTIGEVSTDVVDYNICDFKVKGVKITFYDNNRASAPVGLQRLPYLNKLTIADVASIGIMKMEVMTRRRTHRDYYDMWAILESGVALASIIYGAGKYAEHRLSTKNMLAMLTDVSSITADAAFGHLSPSCDTNLQQLEQSISAKVMQYIEDNHLQKKPSLAAITERFKNVAPQ
ncbi:MAG: nucleotidyl transferase AbiEii/AbiGii toxin family protein [Prevotellaceae bacterium]|jgi:hypothetical protein|nr:nucleotidyl transferase AbiEii/AbiGii toxin family protein [Prevotellaceae bacterium]